jgi:hypothetical protein
MKINKKLSLQQFLPLSEAEILVLLAKHNLNDQVKEDEMGRTCSTNGEKRNAYRILVFTRALHWSLS